ncbi:CinA-like protein [Clostridia bacterium]|nr:CinA-like protein [Clostridia bacterium]
MNYTAEIVAVGTELLLGNVANTDAQIISQGLSELGINVFFHSVVGDNPLRLSGVIEIAKTRSDIIITTGGLGPTLDDLTKETVAACFGRKLELHEPTLKKIHEFFSRIGVTATKNNERQAWLPERSRILENDWGTAPGCAFESDGKRVIMLPGPPSECGSMWQNCAVPYLKELSEAAIVSRRVKVFGMGESAVEDKLHGLMESMSNPTIAPYVGDAEVMLRITAKASDEREAFAMTEPVVEKIRKTLGDLVYGVDVDSLEKLVVDMLAERGLRLAVAESCTGGLMTKRITDIPGASSVFDGGVCAYSNKVKESILGVDPQIIAELGAVSAPVAQAMADGVRSAVNADIGIGITGIAGPDGGSDEKPVGTVYIAISTKDVRKSSLYKPGVDRFRIRAVAVNHALDLIRRYMLGKL